MFSNLFNFDTNCILYASMYTAYTYSCYLCMYFDTPHVEVGEHELFTEGDFMR